MDTPKLEPSSEAAFKHSPSTEEIVQQQLVTDSQESQRSVHQSPSRPIPSPKSPSTSDLPTPINRRHTLPLKEAPMFTSQDFAQLRALKNIKNQSDVDQNEREAVTRIENQIKQKRKTERIIQKSLQYHYGKVSSWEQIQSIHQGTIKSPEQQTITEHSPQETQKTNTEEAQSAIWKLIEKGITSYIYFKRSTRISSAHYILSNYATTPDSQLPKTTDEWRTFFNKGLDFGKSTLFNGLQPSNDQHLEYMILAFQKRSPQLKNIAAAFCKRSHYNQYRVYALAYIIALAAAVYELGFSYYMKITDANDMSDMHFAVKYLSAFLGGSFMFLIFSVKAYNIVKNDTLPKRSTQNTPPASPLASSNPSSSTQAEISLEDAEAGQASSTPSPEAVVEPTLETIDPDDVPLPEIVCTPLKKLAEEKKIPAPPILKVPVHTSDAVFSLTRELYLEQINQQGSNASQISFIVHPDVNSSSYSFTILIGVNHDTLMKQLQETCKIRTTKPLFTTLFRHVKRRLEGKKY